MDRGCNNPRTHLTNGKGGGEDECNQKLRDWVIDFKERCGMGLTSSSRRPRIICRVPDNLRDLHKSAFVPKMVSIGPWNYLERKGGLQDMEEHKERFLERLLGGKFDRKSGSRESAMEGGREEPVRDQEYNGSVSLEDLVSAMKGLADRARACYSQRFDDIKSCDFIQMLVMDGCFIVELLRLYNIQKAQGNGVMIVDDPIFNTWWMLRTIQHDLLMLENQLPFFVLEKLYKLINKADPEPLEVLAVSFFNPLLPGEDRASKLNTERSYTHLLDIFRSTFLKSVRENVRKNEGLDRVTSSGRQLIPFVSELQEANVKLRKREDFDLLEIAFDDDGTLQIPPLFINEDAVTLFLNFVAYEQCHEQTESFFTSYFMFLESLINSPKDVQILHERGIINHLLGCDDKVPDLLSKLCREIVYESNRCYLYGKMKQVNEYCMQQKSSFRMRFRNLKDKLVKYSFKLAPKPLAIILAYLACVQTYYAILTYNIEEKDSGLQRLPLKFLF